MTVGSRIKCEREHQGIAQTDLAKAVKISKQTLYKYENDIITNIPSNCIEDIAKALKISPGYLMGWEEKFSIESAELDVKLTNMENRLKEYALKLSQMPKEKQEHIMNLIDMLEDKKG